MNVDTEISRLLAQLENPNLSAAEVAAIEAKVRVLRGTQT